MSEQTQTLFNDILESKNRCEKKHAEIYKLITKKVYVCVSISSNDKSEFYIFDDECKLYQRINTAIVKKNIVNELCEYYKSFKTSIRSTNSLIDGVIDSIQTKKSMDEILFHFSTSILNEKFVNDELDCDINALNFRNGLYELNTGVFRERTFNDKVSKCLNYDYKPEVNEQLKTYILENMKKIFNDDDKLLETELRIKGYCLTGNTEAQAMFNYYGANASNGKSTTLKMFGYALNNGGEEIYCLKLDSKIFNVDNDKTHKQLIHTKGIRLMYIEEPDKKKMNSSMIKDIVDGDKMSVEIMYSTSKRMDITGKIAMCCNDYLKLEADRGVERRIKQFELTNQFLDGEDYETRKTQRGIYKKDTTFLEKFKTDEYRLTYIQILLPYAKLYYREGLKLDARVEQAYKDISREKDNFLCFLNDTFDITGEICDKVSEKQFLESYRIYTNLKFATFGSILGEINRFDYLGVKRNPNIRFGGEDKRGGITGLKYKGTISKKEEKTEEKPNDNNDEIEQLKKELKAMKEENDELKKQVLKTTQLEEEIALLKQQIQQQQQQLKDNTIIETIKTKYADASNFTEKQIKRRTRDIEKSFDDYKNAYYELLKEHENIKNADLLFVKIASLYMPEESDDESDEESDESESGCEDDEDTTISTKSTIEEVKPIQKKEEVKHVSNIRNRRGAKPKSKVENERKALNSTNLYDLTEQNIQNKTWVKDFFN